MFKLDTEQNMIREMEQAKLKEFKEFVQIFDEATVVLQDKHTQLYVLLDILCIMYL